MNIRLCPACGELKDRAEFPSRRSAHCWSCVRERRRRRALIAAAERQRATSERRSIFILAK
jgi:hypothetical protein